jgi:hypothetical protein
MEHERAARLPGRKQRAMGYCFGGISSSAVATMRQKFRMGRSGLEVRLEVLQERLDT